MNRLQRLVSSALQVKSSWDAAFLRNVDLGIEEDVTKDPYEKSNLVYDCISTTAKAISQVPLLVEEFKGDGWETVSTEHPWQEIFKRPNYLMDEYSFVEAIIGHLMLDGNSWIFPFPPAAKMPDSIWIIRLQDMKKVTNQNSGNLEGWEYNPGGTSHSARIEVGEIAHVKFWNPKDPIMGLSPLKAGKLPLVSDYKAAKYNERFFDQGAQPGGVLSTDKILGDVQFDRVREQFEGRHLGYQRAHRAAVLEQGLKYTQTGLTQHDMQFLDLRRFNREEILQLFGMKKAILSVTEGLNRATAMQQHRDWWLGTNIPLMRLVQSAINLNILRQEMRLRVVFDISTVEALQEDYNKKVETGERLFKIGFTPNEINQRLSLGFETKPWRNVWYMPMNLIPMNGGSSQELSEQGSSIKKLPAREQRLESCWKIYVKRLAPVETGFEAKVRKLFFEMRKLALNRLFKKTEQDLADEAFEMTEKKIKQVSAGFYQMAVREGMASIVAEIGLEGSFDLNDPEVVAFLTEKPLKIRGVVGTIKNQIRLALQMGAENGESIQQVADRIRSIFNAADNRARAIARTEIIGASNFGRWVQIRASGFKEKEWFTALDERVRDSHRDMQGKKINTEESWVLGTGVTLRYPGDFRGPPEEIINCRCIEVVV